MIGELPEPERTRMSSFCCDVRSEDQLRRAVEGADQWDALVHSIAFASTDAMRNSFLDISSSNFAEAHTVSAHSLVLLARAAAPRLASSASIVGLTYLGAQRVRAKRRDESLPRRHFNVCFLPSQASLEYGVMGPAKASLEACARALAVAMVSRSRVPPANVVGAHG